MSEPSRIWFKLEIHPDIPLRKEAENRRKFALMLPIYSVTIKDLKSYLLKQLCRGDVELRRLEMCVDAFYVLRDAESVGAIRFYNDQDKIFSLSLKNSFPASYASSISDPPSTIENGPGTSEEMDTSYKTLPRTVKAGVLFNEEDFGDIMDTKSCGRPGLPTGIDASTDTSRNSEGIQSGKEHETETDLTLSSNERGGPVGFGTATTTRSAKRRERLRRSLSKRMRIDGDAFVESSQGQGMFTVSHDKKNEGQEEDTEEHLTGEEEFSARPRHRAQRFNRWNASLSYSPRVMPKNETTSATTTEDFLPRETSLSQISTSSSQVSTSLKSSDYEALPSVENINDLKVGDTIAFQLLELSGGSPTVSDFKVAKVERNDGKILALEYLMGGPANMSSNTNTDGEENEYVELNDTPNALDFTRLLNPKMISQASSSNSQDQESVTIPT